MLGNIQSFKQEFDDLAAILESLPARNDGHSKQLAHTIMKQMIQAKKDMQRCESQAAPYLHPKLRPARSKL
jgi:hypothetical protein